MKSKRIFGWAAALLLSLIMVGGLWAQTTMPDDAVSPTNTGSSGRYKTAVDDYIQPTDYAGLKLNKWFGFASFASGTMPRVGSAHKINDLYVALYYSGTFWGGLNDFGGTEAKDTFGGPGGTDKTFTTYTHPVAPANPDNTLAVLIGVADMGFRLGFSSTLDTFKKDEDVGVGVKYYKSYAWENGDLVPQIKWGMAKDLMPKGIRPWVVLDLRFHRDNLVHNEVTGATASGENTANSQNSFEPKIGLGLGGFAFYNENGLKASFDLEYKLTLTTYNNDYSYLDAGKFATKSIKGLNANGGLSERSHINNDIYPSVSLGWSSGNLGLKAKLRGVLNFDNVQSTGMNYKADGSLQNHGDEVVTDIFTFTPRLDLGIQYKIIPNKLTFNAGGRIARSLATTTVDTKASYTNGAKDADSATKTKSTNWGTMTNRLYAGAQFNFTDNAWVEAVTGVSGGNASVFNTANGLFEFGSIAIGLKF